MGIDLKHLMRPRENGVSFNRRETKHALTTLRRATLSVVALGFVAFALPGDVAASPARKSRQGATIVYVVKKGDTLFDLASQFLSSVNAARVVIRLNHVTDPRRIPVGLRLNIPVRLVRQEQVRAQIRSFSGAVMVGDGERMLAATPGATVGEGSIIQTGANAFVSLALPDGTIITMPSQTGVRIGMLRRTPLTGSIDRRFEVIKGRVRAVVVPMTDPRSTFKVGTPVAVSAVRGTEFQVYYDPTLNRAVTEVITGKVAVKGLQRSDILVAAGYAAIAQPGAPVSVPRPLLPPPEPAIPPGRQRGATLSFTVKPLPGAVAYRLQIARDAGFLDQISETDSTGPDITLQSLPDGTYFARLSALDAAGVEGRSEIYGFQRRLHGITTSMDRETQGDRRNYLFRWNSQGAGTYAYRFQLGRCGGERLPIVDQDNIADFNLTASDLPNGTYCWRVQSVEVGNDAGDVIWSDTKTFTIAP